MGGHGFDCHCEFHGDVAHRVSLSVDLFEDPQLRARGHFTALDHPEVGPTPYEASRFVLSRTPARLSRAAPMLGQHNAWVLGEILGLTDEAQTDLVIAGAIE